MLGEVQLSSLRDRRRLQSCHTASERSTFSLGVKVKVLSNISIRQAQQLTNDAKRGEEIGSFL
jgi:hypothetical protein